MDDGVASLNRLVLSASYRGEGEYHGLVPMSGAFSAPWVLGVAAVLVFLISLAASRLAVYAQLLPDEPNSRSSHRHVVSRAGGVGIFFAWFAGMLVIAAFSGSSELAIIAVKFVFLAMAAFFLGLADDKWTLSPLLKFSGQFAAAIGFIWIFSAFAYAPLPFIGEAALGGAGVILTIVWIAGFMNTFNFMDGVNGIAAGCAAAGLTAFSVIAAFVGAPFAAISALLLAIACLGFLPSNLGRGKLFMGDSGSLSISFIIAALAVYAAQSSEGKASILIMPVIFFPFLFDVSWTLARRFIRGENVLSAHREHFYQLILRMGYSHAKVAAIYIGLTAICAAMAIFMLTLTPQIQWITVAVLVLAFTPIALITQKAALQAGLFDEKQVRPSGMAEMAAESLKKAAE